MEDAAQAPARLVLLIDVDPVTRNVVRPLLAPKGLELIQARNSVAGLEILQRLPGRFRLVIVNLEMPGLSGAVLLETLRVCCPALPVVCLTLAERAAVASGDSDCLEKPFHPAELRAQVEDALAGLRESVARVSVDAETLARARSAFAATGSLLDAAREIGRCLPGESSNGW